MKPSEVTSTAVLGFGAGFGVGFLSSSIAQMYDDNPLPSVGEQIKIHQRAEIIALATGIVGAGILVFGSTPIHRTMAGAMLASSAFSVGLLAHSGLQS